MSLVELQAMPSASSGMTALPVLVLEKDPLGRNAHLASVITTIGTLIHALAHLHRNGTKTSCNTLKGAPALDDIVQPMRMPRSRYHEPELNMACKFCSISELQQSCVQK